MNRNQYFEGDVIATSTDFGGIEVYYITDERMYIMVGVMGDEPTKHRAKIYYDTEIPYIRLYGRRIRLDSFIRV